jgi:hypothetical protein
MSEGVVGRRLAGDQLPVERDHLRVDLDGGRIIEDSLDVVDIPLLVSPAVLSQSLLQWLDCFASIARRKVHAQQHT